MHYNENSNRLQAVTKSGRPVYSYSFPRARGGEAVIREKKTEPTYGELTMIYYIIYVMLFFYHKYICSVGMFVLIEYMFV